MKKQFIVLTIATLILMTLPQSVVAPGKNTTQKIYFSFEKGDEDYYVTVDILTQLNVYEAGYVYAEFDGNIRAKEGEDGYKYWYLSPLKGTITIDDKVYQILVKPYSPSEPISYYEIKGDPCEQAFVGKHMFCLVEVNIEGNRHQGYLECNYEFICLHPYITQSSILYFEGLVDKKHVWCHLEGIWPEIE